MSKRNDSLTTYRARKRAGLVTPRGANVPPKLRRWAAAMYFGRHAKQAELAKFLGCAPATISRIVRDHV